MIIAVFLFICLLHQFAFSQIVNPPANLSAVPLCNEVNCYIALSWDDTNPTYEEDFIIQRAQSQIGPFEDIAIVQTNAYNDDTGDEINLYFYRVAARYNSFESGYSDYTLAKVPLFPPSHLSVEKTGANEAILSWNNNSSISNLLFRIQVSQNGGPYSLLVPPPPTTTNTYRNLENLNHDFTYSYRVRAEDGVNNMSFYCTPVSYMPCLLPPDNLAACPLSFDEIELSWNDNSSCQPTHYQLERKTGGSSYMVAGEIPYGTTVYHDTGLSAMTSYTYRMRACYNTDFHSRYTDEVSAVTLDYPVPDIPQNLAVDILSDTHLQISWDDVFYESGYHIERKTSYGDFQFLADNDLDQTVFLDSGLQPDTEYVYRVQAFNNVGTSAYSEELSVTT